MRYFFLIIGLLVGFSTAIADEEVKLIAPGWGDLKYSVPEAGTYSLPPLWNAADGEILLTNGKSAQLAEIYGHGKITVLSFIYTQCDDVNGCPLATFVLHSVKNRLKQYPELFDNLRLISLSFDPDNDTPESLQTYSKDFQQDNFEWLFATTESDKKLRPILNDYGQYVIRTKNEDGENAFAHMLRVYLIDKDQQIRNIYSTDFLHPELLIADIKTLLLESS